MEYLIQKYLSENNLSGKNGIDYTLQDDGGGAYIKDWNFSIEKPEFSAQDFKNQELELAKLEKISICIKYLESTDWQIIRLADPSSNEVLKDGVAQNRANARTLQDTINNCSTLKELNAININFV